MLVMPKTSRVTTCCYAEYSRQGIFTGLSRNRSHHRFVHDTRFSSPFLSLFFPSWYILSPHTSRFIFHLSSFPFLYPVLWLLTMTSSKGTSCSHLFFRVGIFEGFKLTHHRKPFQVISKLGVRYTGVFDHINQEDQTICLAQGMSLSLL